LLRTHWRDAVRYPDFALITSQSDKRASKKKREETSESERGITPQNHMAGPMMQLRRSEDYEGDSYENDEDDDEDEDSYIFTQHDIV
jgi:hypothetical protein